MAEEILHLYETEFFAKLQIFDEISKVIEHYLPHDEKGDQMIIDPLRNTFYSDWKNSKTKNDTDWEILIASWSEPLFITPSFYKEISLLPPFE